MNSDNLELTTLGGGCFWCLEPVFEELQGVERVVVGYAGGSVEDPSYKDVTSGGTGHAEVAQVTFDPNILSFGEILGVFFSIHDPTTLNRQGADVGTQYRSVILYHSDEQQAVAAELIGALNAEGVFPNPIVTEVAPFDVLYEAEEYHQDYYEKNPNAGYCMAENIILTGFLANNTPQKGNNTICRYAKGIAVIIGKLDWIVNYTV